MAAPVSMGMAGIIFVFTSNRTSNDSRATAAQFGGAPASPSVGSPRQDGPLESSRTRIVSPAALDRAVQLALELPRPDVVREVHHRIERRGYEPRDGDERGNRNDGQASDASPLRVAHLSTSLGAACCSCAGAAAYAPHIELAPTHLTLRGDAVGDADGTEVHVPGLFVGERARIEIVHRSRQHPLARGRLIELLEPHPARRAAPCPHHQACGGCPLMELEEPAQRAQKRVLLEALGIEVDEVIAGDAALGYRRSSKRVAFNQDGALHLGSWARGTHDGASMRTCRVDHPKIVAAFAELEDRARTLGVTAYDETSTEGALRYAWAKTDGARVLLTIVFAGRDRAVDALADLRADGVAFAFQDARTNAIRGSSATIVRGIEHLEIEGARIGPLAFMQPNPALVERAYDDLCSGELGAPLGGSLAWDLYAGGGSTTRRLERTFERVETTETDPEHTAAPISTEAFLAAAAGTPDLVVANPPRRGLGEEVCAQLARAGVPRIHLMSCGPEGLVRDLSRLPGYRLASLRAYDTLPQTPHVELVAKLTKEARPDSV